MEARGRSGPVSYAPRKAVTLTTTEPLSLIPGVSSLYDEMGSVVGERTLAILDRRRKTATIRRRGWLIRRMLVLADIVGLSAAFALAEFVSTHNAQAQDLLPARRETLLFVATLPAWIVTARLYGLYDHDEERTDHSTTDDVIGVCHLVSICAWFLFAASSLTGLVDPDLSKFVVFWALAIVLVPLARTSARAYSRRRITYLQNTLIVGAGRVGQLVAHKLLHHPEYGINLVGFVDREPLERAGELVHVPLLGDFEHLRALVHLLDIERVVIAFTNDSHEETVEIIRSLKDMDIQVDIVPRLFEIVGPRAELHNVEGLPLLGLPPLRLAQSSRALKRSVDLVFSLLGLIVLGPAFIVIAILIKRDSPGPVFFRQERVGVGEHVFRIYKFRTMVVDADDHKAELAHANKHSANGDGRMFKVPNDPRITPIGRRLRRYSIDELPQLINVVKGEMSLVGPRPLILDEHRRVRDWARRRLRLQPGITGPWQVLGASDIPMDEMETLDYLYVTGWTLFNDFKLILRTFPALVRAHDAY
jgi:exopolysaccharide biosynthesis polyprenyl glycosylphosphotransferase